MIQTAPHQARASRGDRPADTARPTCPLSGEVLVDPVRAWNGRAYSAASLHDLPVGHPLRRTDQPGPWPDRNLADQLGAYTAAPARVAAAEDLPEHLVCPISAQPLVDAVVASDGRTYDRATIARIYQSQGRSPFTREPLDRRVIRNAEVCRQAAHALGRVSSGEGASETVIHLAAIDTPALHEPTELGLVGRLVGAGITTVVSGFLGATAGAIAGVATPNGGAGAILRGVRFGYVAGTAAGLGLSQVLFLEAD